MWDPSGHDFFIGQNDFPDLNGENDLLDSEYNEVSRNIDSQNYEVVETSKHPPVSDEDKNEIDRDDRAYSEYAKTDPIRLFQFHYDEHVALASVFPAAKVDANTLHKKNPSHASNNNNLADVDPGEGQIPTSILN